MANGYNLANAYVTVMPSAEGMTTKLTDALFPGLSSAGEDAGRTLGGGVQNGVSAMTVAIGNVIGKIATNAASSFASTISNGINRLDTLESFGRVMTALGESSEDADAAIEKIKGSLDGLPTSTAEMASFVQQIKATGVSLSDSTDYALAFNNAMLAGGKGQAAANEAQTAYQNILVKGSADQLQWLRLVRASPAAMQQLSEELLGAGANQEDLRQAINDGTVSMDEFNEALVKLNKEGTGELASFEEQARAATEGIQTSLDLVGSRMGQAWFKILDAIGQTNITAPINAFSSSFGKMADVVVGGIEAMKPLLASFGEAFDLSGKFQAFSDALAPLQTVFAELFRVVGAGMAENIAAIAAAVLDFGTALAEAVYPVIQALEPLINSIVDYVSNMLIGALEIVTPLLAPLGEALAIILEIITPLVDIFAEWVSQWMGQLAEMLANIDFTPLTQGLEHIRDYLVGYVIPAIAEWYAWLAENILPVFMDLASWIFATGIEMFDQITLWIGEHVVPVIMEMWEWIKDNLLPVLSDMAAWIVDTVVPALQSMFEWIGDNVIPIISDLFDWLASNLIPIFEGVGDIINTFVVPAFEGIAGALSSVLDWIGWVIDGISDLIGWIQSIPSIDIFGGISSLWGGFTGMLGFASGGMITEPTIALRGERGPEFEWPSYEPYMSRYAAAIAANLPEGAGGGGIDIHDNQFNVRNDDDIRQIAYAIDDIVYTSNRSQGRRR